MDTLVEAIRYFSDPQVCIDTVAAMRWADGKPTCPKCGGQEHYYLKARHVWKCKAKGCAKQFSVKVGTIFEDSPITLDKWLVAMWMLASCKNGISSYEISRDLGVTQKTAWFMMHRIRVAMKEDYDPAYPMGNSPANQVEIDETFVGGKPKNMHASRRIKREQEDHKAIVMGMLTRTTREVRAKVIPNVKRETLQAEILKNVGWGSVVYTDQHVGYDNVRKVNNYIHKTVNHMQEYVNGKVHTQGIENFWALLKRSLSGTYVAVEPFHLDRYVDEQVFRYNNRRNRSDKDRFGKVLSQIAGKRLTYAEVTGKVGETTF